MSCSVGNSWNTGISDHARNEGRELWQILPKANFSDADARYLVSSKP